MKLGKSLTIPKRRKNYFRTIFCINPKRIISQVICPKFRGFHLRELHCQAERNTGLDTILEILSVFIS